MKVVIVFRVSNQKFNCSKRIKKNRRLIQQIGDFVVSKYP